MPSRTSSPHREASLHDFRTPESVSTIDPPRFPTAAAGGGGGGSSSLDFEVALPPPPPPPAAAAVGKWGGLS